MRHALLFTALVTGLLQVAAPVSAPRACLRPRPRRVGLSGERLAQIGKVFGAEVDQGRLPGAVVAVARKGKLVYFEALGYQDKPADKKMQKDSIFRVYSMTKPWTSLAAMMLVEDGKIQLPDPVSKFLPAFKGLNVSVATPNVDHRANYLRAGAGRARAHHPGSAAPHIGRRLRLRHPQRAGQGGL